jgi:thiamine-phosphate pyrophosphorylase
MSGCGRTVAHDEHAQVIDPNTLRLVAITDNLRDGIEGLAGRARAACRGGATMIHLRLPDESARTLASAARALKAAVDVPVVVHCRVDVALAAEAAGVHLGVHDAATSDVRRLVPKAFVIGRSAGGEDDLRCAAGADYVTLGPVFAAGDRVREPAALGLTVFQRLVGRCEAPIVAIGGISSATAADAIRAGARGVAVISGVFGARDPESSTRAVRSAIGT